MQQMTAIHIKMVAILSDGKTEVPRAGICLIHLSDRPQIFTEHLGHARLPSSSERTEVNQALAPMS